jgi:predicted DNA-binding transcriptional regulator AlpA
MSKPLLARPQVVERLNVTEDWFYRHRRDLEAEGFPKSLPGFKQGRWCPQAVEAWIARHSGAPAAQEPAPQAAEDPQEALRQALQDRAQAIASSGKRGPGGAS